MQVIQNRAIQLLLCQECRTHAQHRKRLFTSPKGRDREKLLEIQIERIFQKNRGTYGVRRIHNKLAEESIRTSLRRVRRIMRPLNLVANDNPKPLSKSYKVREHIHRANIVCQNFKTSEKNHPCPRQGIDRVWLSDMTYVKVREFHWCYLVCVLDLYNRKVIGYALLAPFRVENLPPLCW